MTVFGTRPEVIKLAPVIKQLEAQRDVFSTVNVVSGQHKELLYPLVHLFNIDIYHDLQLMTHAQTPSHVCSRVLVALDPILVDEQPDLILVQGDTTTALAAALAGFHRRVAVGHVEAGLRSGNLFSPYPEEMNRRLITRLATYHFAATPRNQRTLLSEGVAPEVIFLTGNPIVDALTAILERTRTAPPVEDLLAATSGLKRIVLTTHRRESFGEVLAQNLKVLRSFVERHEDVALVFPVHPNPAVVTPATEILSGHPRIHLVHPFPYDEFIVLLSHAWLIVSDSGGVQEEAPTLGKPLLVLRENTERPEAVESGVARLVGRGALRLARALEDAYVPRSWVDQVGKIKNPFGDGTAGQRIARIVAAILDGTLSQEIAGFDPRDAVGQSGIVIDPSVSAVAAGREIAPGVAPTASAIESPREG